MSDKIRIVTRTSILAVWQTQFVERQIKKIFPELDIELIGIKTQGDKILDTPLAKIGGKGLFTKELEVALLENRADIAVHSLKDMPVIMSPGLTIAAICKRHDARDALISRSKNN